MEPVVIACGGCGTAIRIRHPEIARRRFCPRCRTDLTRDQDPVCRQSLARLTGILIAALLLGTGAMLGVLTSASHSSASHVRGESPSARPDTAPAQLAPVSALPPSPTLLAMRTTTHEGDDERIAPAAPPLPCAPAAAEPQRADPVLVEFAAAPAAGLAQAPPEPPRFKVRDEQGQPVVARLHGQHEGTTALILPDGQLGFPNMLVPTDEPFQPFTADELLARLQKGPLGDFQIHQTAHYLIFFQSSRALAEASGRWLEDLYKRLLDAFRKHEMAVHDTEFPLVAVIYRTERDFRASKRVDPEVQAVYEIGTNRIYFYETSEHDENAPELSALRKPQTVVHEGTHQVLQNIGVHPRLSAWPIWLVEGLAEYCSTPASSRKGGKPTWDGLGMINGLHMATIRELEDPLSVAIRGDDGQSKALVREPGKPLVECLVRKTHLTPTEYALAWAMTHYLAFKRQDDFVAYLKVMSQIPPLEPRTPEDHLAEFRKAFGSDLVKIDKTIDRYLKNLAKQKGYDPMPFYAATYEQSLPAGLLKRAAMVSQSPQMIQQWVEEISNPLGAQPTWQALPHATRARALLAVEEYMKGH
ncbi:MAG: DUF1570 domain-containing protein [Planctomycetaceae bacterium]|nr:DUF1570 domain-containing protein [Planctomycetaceae bacterium]MBV8310801.1 DUF1570 domain-containing protein [Planctomycetaceae bacterium]